MQRGHLAGSLVGRSHKTGVVGSSKAKGGQSSKDDEVRAVQRAAITKVVCRLSAVSLKHSTVAMAAIKKWAKDQFEEVFGDVSSMNPKQLILQGINLCKDPVAYLSVVGF